MADALTSVMKDRRAAMTHRIVALALALLAWPGPGRVAIAASTHHHHPRPAEGGGPVLLTAQPNSPLDATARTLTRYDLEQAAHHGDQPLVLIGSARLDPRSKEAALFVQLQSASLCGSAGCSTSVYLHRGGDWLKVLDSVSGPIRVLPATHGGMHDLMVNDDDRWVWNGRGYRDTLAAPSMDGLKRSIERHQKTLPPAQRSTAPSDTSP